MTRTGRSRSVTRRGMTLRDLDGYALVAPPKELPAFTGKPPSPKAVLRLLVEKVYAADPIFALRATSVSNKDAETGSYHADKALAAARLYDQAKREELSIITDIDKVIGKISRNWLPALMAERGLNRQARIAAAIDAARQVEAASSAANGQPSGE